MNIDDGSLDFDVYFNNKNFNKAVDESEKRVKGFSKAVVAEGEKIDDAFKVTADNIRIQKEVIAKLETEIANLNIEISKLPNGSMSQKELKTQSAQLTAELNAEKNALKQLEAELGKTEEKTRSYRSQIREAREALIAMEQAGKRGTPEYQALQARLGELTDAMSDAQAQATVLANDERGFQGVVSMVSGLTGAFSAAQGAIGLFAGENENLNKIMLKVQSLMAITIGLQQVAQTLNKDSYFSIVVLTKAKELWAAANLKVATTLGITTAAATALMAALTLGLSVAITAIIVALSKLSSKSSEARKELKAFNESIVDNAYKSIAAVEQLSTEWDKLGNNLKAKEKFIEDNKDKFEELGASVRSVKDAENLLIDNKDKFIESLILKAKALATADLAAQKYKEAITKELELEKTPKTVTRYVQQGQFGGMITYEDENRKYKKIENQKKELEREGLDLFKKAAELTAQEKAILEDIGVSSNNIVEGSIAALEQNINKLKDKLKNAATDKERAELRKQIKAQEKLLEKMNPTETKTEDEKKKAAEELKKQLQEQSTLRRELTLKEREAAVAAMKDGFDKEMAELRLEHEQKLEEIRAYEEKLLQAQNEVAKQEWIKASDFKPSTTLNTNDRLIVGRLTDAENSRFAASQNAVLETLLDKYRSFDEKKRDIDKAYMDEYNRLTMLMNGKNTAEITAKQKELARLWKEDINELQNSVLKDYKLDGLMDDASGYLMQKVKEALPFFHSISEASTEELYKIREVINAIEIPQSVIDELKAKGVDVKLLEKIIQNLKNAATEGQSQIQEKLLNKYVDAAKQFGSILSQSGDEFVQKVGNLISQLGATIGTMTSKSATGFDKVSSIIGLAITVGNYLKSIREDRESRAINEQKKVTNEVANQVAFETEINRLYTERIAMQNESIFLGTDYASVMSDSMSSIAKYNTQLNETLGDLFTNAIFSSEGSAKRKLFGTKKGTYEFSLLDIIKGMAPKVEKDDTLDWFGVGLGFSEWNITKDIAGKIKNGNLIDALGKLLDPLHLFGGGPADQKAKLNAFNNLKDSVTEALSAMGKSVSDFATMSTDDMLTFFTLMEKSGNVTDEGTKKLLASAREQMEQIKKAQEEMRAAIKEVAGSLGQSIQDILEEAFRNGFAYGPEQAKKVSAEISKILEDMLSSMIYQQAFATLFKNLQSGMENSFGANGDQSWIDDFKVFMSGVPAAAAMFNEGMKQAQDAAKLAGFDLWGKDTAEEDPLTGAAKGITSEQASLLAGQTNAMRINQVEANQILRNQLLSLNKIAENTAFNVNLTKLNDILEIMKSRQTDPLRGQGL